MDILDIKCIPTKRRSFALNPGVYEVSDINKTLESILLDNVKLSNTIDDIRLKSNLKNNQTLIFTKRSFFYTLLGFVESQLGVLGDSPGFVQLILGSYKSDKSINITGIDKVRLKCECVNGSIINGVRQAILYNFALSLPTGHKVYKEPRIKLFEKINKPVLSHIVFYLEVGDHKPYLFKF